MRHAIFALLVTSAVAAAGQQVVSTGGCPPMAIGADVSFLPEAEAQGRVFRVAGQPAPGLRILQEHGYSWVRLRLFNSPQTLPNTLAYTLAEAKSAKALGFHLLLDLHYSDDWADPSHQTTPLAWQKLTHAQLTEAVYRFTRDTVSRFIAEGVTPDMVQVGNEITAGILWPDGQLPEHWDNFNDLLAAGVRGVREGGGHSPATRIMLHIDKGGSIDATRWFFSHILAARIDFDVIGQSFYPWWQGSLSDLRANLAFMASQYHKPIFIVETAYSWKPDNYLKTPAPFPETPAGQRTFLQGLEKVVAGTPDGLGQGIFWWEPMVKGPLERRGLFDSNGDALPALDVFNHCAL